MLQSGDFHLCMLKGTWMSVVLNLEIKFYNFRIHAFFIKEKENIPRQETMLEGVKLCQCMSLSL
jgi:hypothetical protein